MQWLLLCGALKARPISHRKRDLIEAHLPILFAAPAVGRWIEAQTGWSIRKFGKIARRYAPSRSRPGGRRSPPPIPSPTTSAKRSTLSAAVRTNLSQLRSEAAGHSGRGWVRGPYGRRFTVNRLLTAPGAVPHGVGLDA
jgi:hypothetical protein